MAMPGPSPVYLAIETGGTKIVCRV
ncbi:MAG: hypothetical protein JWR59_1713, partial [Brevundimonas sp.]|nr:hypothetical protein [Brevundimonas sp.]